MILRQSVTFTDTEYVHVLLDRDRIILRFTPEDSPESWFDMVLTKNQANRLKEELNKVEKELTNDPSR